MDSFKEVNVALANDRWMQRGVAVLSIDGPGQYESPLLGLYVSMQNWIDAGPAVVDWLLRRPEIDGQKIGVTGTSFGSFFGTILELYLVVADEADELIPREHTERMVRAVSGPRQLVVYADRRHSVGKVPAANLGPFPPILVADWLVARLSGKPFNSERWYVEATGRIVKT